MPYAAYILCQPATANNTEQAKKHFISKVFKYKQQMVQMVGLAVFFLLYCCFCLPLFNVNELHRVDNHKALNLLLVINNSVIQKQKKKFFSSAENNE